MKVPESIAMSIPSRLIPLAQEVIDDAPDCSFDECLAHWSLGPVEKLRTALIEYPKNSVERAAAIREMREYLSLVEFAAVA